MKIPEIKKLVLNYSLDVLDEAELSLINEEKPKIEVGGEDEGEQLTHIMAAKFIIEDMQNFGSDFKTSLRKYTTKVRNSIS